MNPSRGRQQARVALRQRLVILLRGVNVGRAKRVPMAEWRTALEELGLGEVRTVLNSGNAVVSAGAGRSAAELALAIAASIETRFGVVTPVIVKSAADLGAIVAHNPIVPSADEHARSLVVFGAHPESLQGLHALQPLLQAGERLAITQQAAYLHCAGGLLQSRAAKALLGKLGSELTTRNWATTLRLQALLQAAPA